MEAPQNRHLVRLAVLAAIAFVLFITDTYLVKSRIERLQEEQMSEDFEFVDSYTDSGRQYSEAERIGQSWTNGVCSGYGRVSLSALPMKPEDFAFIIPYGLVVGAHVTPIDHQYFSPVDPASARDSYEVYAMADGLITQIQHRSQGQPGAEDYVDEYRIVFSHSCTFFTYYDLVTSLVPELQAEFDVSQNGGSAALDYEVQAGQLIGHIGGQTLDFAVWDTEQTLSGFVVPEHYESEAWKIHTADPLPYYTKEVKKIVKAKILRTASPISGRIDHDEDGRLIGNWFEEGTNGYTGVGDNYYQTHLSIAPDHIDPDSFIISFGDYSGEPRQFTTQPDAVSPLAVGLTGQPVKYELRDYGWAKADGTTWDRFSPAQDLTLIHYDQVHGCVLFQLVQERQLQMEVFPGQDCNGITGFGDTVRTYER